MTTAPTPFKTTCPYCGTGCGVSVRPAPGGFTVSGDETHPTNRGRLCVKGAALAETLVPNGRLLHPQVRDPVNREIGNAFKRVSWDTALDLVAREFQRIMYAHGPDAVAWYVSGQLLTEDYYVANKLVKGFVGTANIDTNSRLCMSSAVAGHKRAFGEDIVPVSYADLELADLIVLVGSNTAWCHPVLYQRILAAKARRPQMKIVVIDPRRTATTEAADLHLPLKPGSDVALFNGLLSFLNRYGMTDQAFVAEHTRGLEAALSTAGNADIAEIAKACALEHADVAAFFQMFARTEKVVTAFSMGVNQSSTGSDKVNSIINCHLLTGRIGKPGAGPFSITGQPNAMGGREVGGLSNMLAAHMELDNAAHRERVQTFWSSPHIASRPGLRAVELFDAIERGTVKAVWIMGTNPVVSLPNADKVRRALDKCELVVVSDVMEKTDTTAYGHVLLPALAWGEKDGTVTNSERCISRQRAFLSPPGEAKPDWWALSEVAKRWGFGAQFGYHGPHEIFDEHARLTARHNADPANDEAGDARYLNLSGLVGLGSTGYDALQPLRWPVLTSPGEQLTAPAPVFADGRFFHRDGRARFVSTSPLAPVNPVSERYPLVLNTGRIRDHWHTMTRTGLSARLSGHIVEPFVDLHRDDLQAFGLRENALARVRSRWGSVVARVRCSGEMPRGSVFVPIHWNDQFASDAGVGSVVNPAVDPVSGEPEFKHTPVLVEPVEVRWHAFILSRHSLPMQTLAWWTRVTGEQFQRYEVAGDQEIHDWPEFARSLLGVVQSDADWLDFEDGSSGSYRAAWIVEDRLEACVFFSPRPELPARHWLSSLFAKARLDDADRTGLLAAAAAGAMQDTGPTVCACHGVGQHQIVAAIRDGCDSTEALGARLSCGTNCGSCVPELKRLLGATLVPA